MTVTVMLQPEAGVLDWDHSHRKLWMGMMCVLETEWTGHTNGAVRPVGSGLKDTPGWDGCPLDDSIGMGKI